MIRLKRKTKSNELELFGLVTKREDEYLVLTGTNPEGTAFVGKFPRQASLEQIRLDGVIKTVATGFQTRSGELTDLRVFNDQDKVATGTEYLSQLKKQKTNLAEKRTDFSINDLGNVIGTTANKKDVAEAVVSVEAYRAKLDDRCPVVVESRGRAALRYVINQKYPVNSEFSEAISNEVLLLTIVEQTGYSILFWSETRGLFYEIEQPFNGIELEDNWGAVADDIRKYLTRSSLSSLNVNSVNEISVVSEENCFNFLQEELQEDEISLNQIFFDTDRFSISQDSQSLVQNRTATIIAAGLIIRDDRISEINLNRDFEVYIQNANREKLEQVQNQNFSRARNLKLLLLAPLTIVIICLGIFFISLKVQDHYVTQRQENADAEEAALKPITAEIETIKNTSDQVQNVSTQISALKTKQPGNFLLLMSLNRKWSGFGPTEWQIDEVTTKSDGTITIKGKTTNDLSLTEFTKSLDTDEEFASVKVSKSENGIGAAAIGTGSAERSGAINFAVEASYSPLQTSNTSASVINAPPSGQNPTKNAAATKLPTPPQIATGNNQSKPNF